MSRSCSPNQHDRSHSHGGESQRGRTRHRHQANNDIHDIPPSLAESPYLSSPIRPIRSWRSLSRGGSPNGRSKSCNPRQSGSRSVSSCARPKSPHSCASSLYQPSPYNDPLVGRTGFNDGDSLFSVKRRRGADHAVRSATRTILLPSEVDDLLHEFLNHQKGISNEDRDHFDGQERTQRNDAGDNQPDVPNLSARRRESTNKRQNDNDDNSSVTSEDAISLDDNTVFQRCQGTTGMLHHHLPSRESSGGGGYSDFTSGDFQEVESHASVPTVKLPPVSSKESLDRPNSASSCFAKGRKSDSAGTGSSGAHFPDGPVHSFLGEEKGAKKKKTAGKKAKRAKGGKKQGTKGGTMRTTNVVTGGASSKMMHSLLQPL